MNRSARSILVCFAWLAAIVAPTTSSAQIFGSSSKAQDCAVAISGSVDTSVVTNICGVPSETLQAIVEEFKKNRTTLESLASDRQQMVDLMRQTLALTNGQIQAAFEVLGERNIPPERLAARLVEVARRYKDLESLANARPGDTPEIAALKAKAKQAIEAGNAGAADHLLVEIEARQAKLADQFALSRSETRASRGQVALANLDYPRAASFFAEAAELVPKGDAYFQTRIGYLEQEANILDRSGVEFGGRAALELAIERWQRLSDIQGREGAEAAWAATLNKLGSALIRLRVHMGESGSKHLEQAKSAQVLALVLTKRENLPLEWAKAQVNIGDVLMIEGLSTDSMGSLRSSEASYRQAIQVLTRDKSPFEWAYININIGIVLTEIDKRSGESAGIEEAIVDYHAAQDVLSRERFPLQWAEAQRNLGDALSILGERENSTERLEAAVAVYRAALEVVTRKRFPLEWGRIQSGLGGVLAELGVREGGTGRLKEAAAAFRDAIQSMTRERAPFDWAINQANLATVLIYLASRESGTLHLEAAIAASRASLEEITRDRTPQRWAKVQRSLGYALIFMGLQEGGTARLEEALDALEACLTVKVQDPQYKWAINLESTIDDLRAEIAQRKSQ